LPQHEIEVILMRELASYLALAVFVVDPTGELIYYNEPAERLLGTRFDETGPIAMADWSALFAPSDGTSDIEPSELPLGIAVERQRPAQGSFLISGRDGVTRWLEVTAVPLLGIGGRMLGAAAFFRELGGG
jgi:PAS domain-containing protein